MLVRAGYEASESYHMFDSRDNNAATNSVRPFVGVGYGGTLILDESTGISSYSALVISAEKRMSGGLSFLGRFRADAPAVSLRVLQEVSSHFLQMSSVKR